MILSSAIKIPGLARPRASILYTDQQLVLDATERPKFSIPRPSVVLFTPLPPWKFKFLSIALGVLHLLCAVCIILLDLVTNWITNTQVATISGICFMLCGIICLIASKMFDVTSLFLLCFLTAASEALSIFLIVECSVVIDEGRLCRFRLGLVIYSRITLLTICSVEAVLSIVTYFISVRSLIAHYKNCYGTAQV